MKYFLLGWIGFGVLLTFVWIGLLSYSFVAYCCIPIFYALFGGTT